MNYPIFMPKSGNRIDLKRKFHHNLLMAMGIGISVVAFWRGTWGLMDLYLFPNNPTLSSFASLAIGVIILYLTHYLVRELI
jgi:hypothetical protein